MPRAKKSPPFTLLSQEDRTKLGDVAQTVWQEIGADCLRAVAECAETNRQRSNPTMTRAEVLEVVIDADRLRMAVRMSRTVEEAQKDRLIAFLKDAPYETVLATLRPAFGFARYGW